MTHGERVSESVVFCRKMSWHPAVPFWFPPATSLSHTPSTAGTFRKKFRKHSGKTPETLSERFLEFTSREYGWDPPNPLKFMAVEASRAFPDFSPPQYGWGRLCFQKWFRRGPLRVDHGIPSSTLRHESYCENNSLRIIFRNFRGIFAPSKSPGKTDFFTELRVKFVTKT